MAGTSRRGALGACWPRVPAQRPAIPQCSAPRRRARPDGRSPAAKLCAGSLPHVFAPGARPSRLGRCRFAAQPSPAAGLSASRRSSLRRVRPVGSFPRGLGSGPRATLTAADCCPAVSAAGAALRPFPWPAPSQDPRPLSPAKPGRGYGTSATFTPSPGSPDFEVGGPLIRGKRACSVVRVPRLALPSPASFGPHLAVTPVPWTRRCPHGLFSP
jgi:hypothetical protein